MASAEPESAAAPSPPQGERTSIRPGGYEFSKDQESVMRELAGAMRLVGVAGMVFGALALVVLVVGWFAGGPAEPSSAAGRDTRVARLMVSNGVGVVAAVVSVCVGVWVRAAGRHFHQVAATQGNDITHLMQALGELRKMYGFQRWVILAGLVLLVALGGLWVVLSSVQ